MPAPRRLAEPRGHRRLLVADESESTRRAVAHCAATLGIDVEEAVDGSDVLARVAAAAAAGLPFETAVLGVRLADTSGAEMAAAVASSTALRGARVVLIGTPAEQPPDLAAYGAAAFVSIPLRRSRLLRALLEPAEAPPDSFAPLEAATDDHNRPAHHSALPVLVAEDNPVNQRLVARMLEKRGLRAHVVTDGGQALEALERGHYAAVLMDCQMPGMDGYEATRELRRRERERPGRHVPVIAMTAHAMSGDREHCLAAGMDDSLRKPLEVEACDSALVRWVAGDRERTGAGRLEEELPADVDIDERDRADAVEADAAVVLLREELGEDFLDELWNGVLEQAPGALAEMRAATARKDPDSVARSAHTLKGAAATVDASAVVAASRALEDAGRSSRLDEADPLLDRLEQAIRETRAARLAERRPDLAGTKRGG